jgi:hypothetical protein
MNEVELQNFFEPLGDSTCLKYPASSSQRYVKSAEGSYHQREVSLKQHLCKKSVIFIAAWTNGARLCEDRHLSGPESGRSHQFNSHRVFENVMETGRLSTGLRGYGNALNGNSARNIQSQTHVSSRQFKFASAVTIISKTLRERHVTNVTPSHQINNVKMSIFVRYRQHRSTS